MLTRRALGIARMRGWVPTTWRGWLLLDLVPLWLAGVVVAQLTNGSAVGGGLVFAAMAGGLVVDARGFLTLGGRVRWRRLGLMSRAVIAALYLLTLVVPSYAVLSDADSHRWRRQEIEATPAQIARLEREPGMDRPPK